MSPWNRARSKFAPVLGIALSLVFALDAVTPAHGATLTWTGAGGDGSVTTAANWSPGQAPVTGDSIIFAGAVSLSPQLSSSLSLATISFASGASAFTLGGAGTYTLTSATAITNNSSNLETINNKITLGIDQTWNAASGDLSFGGAVNTNGSMLTISGAYNTTISSIISGSGGLTKSGTGTLTLSGSAANTFTGTMSVNGGTVVLAKTSGNAIAGLLTIGDGVGTDTVQLAASNQINNKALTINSSGVLDLNNYSDAVGTLTMTGGSVTTGTGLLTLGGNITTNASASSATIAGNLDLGANRTFTVADGAAADDLIVSANINSSSANLTKSGTGTLVLSGSNILHGVAVTAGVLSLRSSGALGLTSPVVSAGAAIQLQSGISLTNTFTLNGSGIANDGALRNVSGNNTVSGGITLGSSSTIGSDAGTLTLSGALNGGGGGKSFDFVGAGNTTVTGVISNNGSVTMDGTGVLTLSGTNTYSGGSFIDSGTVAINSASSLGATTSGVTINAGVLEATATFTTSRLITLANAASTIMVDPSQTYTVSSAISGTGALTKTGSGTLTLSGTNTYSGGTVINGGTIVANSSASLGASGVTATINAGTLEVSASYSSARNFVVGDTASTIMVDPSQTFTVGNVISGSGNLNKSGTGTLVLNGADTYTGSTYVTAGTLSLGAGASIASTSLNVSSGATFNGNATATIPNTLALTANGAVNFNATTRTIASLDGASSGVVTLNSTNLTTSSGTYSGVLQNGASAGSLTKTGAGTLTLKGADTFTGSTTVSGGTLVAAATAGSALGATSGITVNSGGTLLLGASDQINNSATMTLAGGTFDKGNFSEGSATAAGVGALSLTAANSHIDFGTGTTGVVSFSAFTPNANKVVIDNWTGTINTVGNGATDRLIFAADESANLSAFTFTGYNGATEFSLGNGMWEVVPLTPVPEPGTWAAAACAGLSLAGAALKRSRARRARR